MDQVINWHAKLQLLSSKPNPFYQYLRTYVDDYRGQWSSQLTALCGIPPIFTWCIVRFLSDKAFTGKNMYLNPNGLSLNALWFYLPPEHTKYQTEILHINVV